MVILESEQIRANKAIVCSGRWLSELVPEMTDLVTPIKQHYCELRVHNQNDYQIGRFPSFQFRCQEN